MDNNRLLDQLEINADRLAATASRDLGAGVPPCPGWTVRDVVEHVAEVYEHKIACMQQQEIPDPWPPPWPKQRDPLEWLGDAYRRLRTEFAERGPTAPSPTWWPPDQTVGFWVRRMAQETAVHRVDVDSAFGPIAPVDEELAVDGVDEVLECFLSGDWSDAPVDTSDRVVGVHTGGRLWLVRFAAERVDVDGGSGSDSHSDSADAAIAGEPSDVLLWLWGRLPDAAVRTDGDQACVRMLRDRLVKATQ